MKRGGVVGLGINLVGDAIREALDPTLVRAR